mmetsp:Transcript_12372/g.18617  ORF Transcript_12372/g.18617 Transcript_12372/m.18617 type:complete len:102 (+) Transcript_12372:935-1240(+)
MEVEPPSPLSESTSASTSTSTLLASSLSATMRNGPVVVRMNCRRRELEMLRREGMEVLKEQHEVSLILSWCLLLKKGMKAASMDDAMHKISTHDINMVAVW